MQEATSIATIIASPVAMAAFFMWIYSELRHLRREIEEMRAQMQDLDDKIEKLTRNVGYLEGRINGMREDLR